MPTKLIMEAGQLADAVQKANRIAPTKGGDLDRFGGIFIEISSDIFDSHPVTVRARNTDITYQQKVACAEPPTAGGVKWRVPSGLLARTLSSLPLDQGRIVTFIDQEDGSIRFKSGKFVGKLAMIQGDWPEFPRMMDGSSFAPASDFASKAEQVAWACDAKDAPLSGVHLDGEWIVGCDRYVMARTPCAMPIANPITVPLKDLSQLLSKGSDVRIMAAPDKLYISLDAETQATSTIFAKEYPNVHKLDRGDYLSWIEFDKGAMDAAITRMAGLAAGERTPKLDVTINPAPDTGAVCILDMDAQEKGRFRDEVDCKGEVPKDFSMWINPTFLLQGLAACKADIVRLEFGPNPLQTIKMSDGRGLESIMLPLRKSDPDPPAEKTDAS